MSRLLSVNELEKITNIPSTTIRRYLRNHKDLIRTERKGNVHFVCESALPIIENIRQFYESGKNHAEITALLQSKTKNGEQIKREIMVEENLEMKKDVSSEADELLLAVQARVEAIEEKQMRLLEDLMKQIKRVEESKEVAVKLLEKQLEKKNEMITELEGKVRGYEIMRTSQEVAAARITETNETGMRKKELSQEKTSFYDRLFRVNKVARKNA